MRVGDGLVPSRSRRTDAWAEQNTGDHKGRPYAGKPTAEDTPAMRVGDGLVPSRTPRTDALGGPNAGDGAP